MTEEGRLVMRLPSRLWVAAVNEQIGDGICWAENRR